MHAAMAAELNDNEGGGKPPILTDGEPEPESRTQFGYDAYAEVERWPNMPIIPTPGILERSPSPLPPQSPPPHTPTAVSVDVEEHFPALGAKLPKTLRHTPPLPSSNLRPPPSNRRQRQHSFVHNSVAVSEHLQFMLLSRTPQSSGPPQQVQE